jgi:aspartate/methionine/tyrosine aminotransferase
MFPSLRPEAMNAPPSGIVAVASYGRAREGVTSLWVGEGDMPTPAFIMDAARKSMADGETFYTWQRGIPDMRQAIARYMERVYGRPFSMDRFSVTGGGMQAIQIAMRLLAGPGDEVIVPCPAWPNFDAAIGISGARTVPVIQTLGQGGWILDVDSIAAALTPRTKAIVINSPSNPTGWTATLDELKAVLDLARKHGIWILADEIYGRFVYDAPRAPSFHDLMDDDDQIIFVQTMSKNWAMTGWRTGWIEAPAALGPTIENLIQYSTSGVPVFSQRASIAALENGDDFIESQIVRARASRDLFVDALNKTGRASFQLPQGAFYLFFSIKGITDPATACFRMIDDIKVGIAPGTAFGPGAEKYFRLCFARSPEAAAPSAEKLGKWVASLP